MTRSPRNDCKVTLYNPTATSFSSFSQLSPVSMLFRSISGFVQLADLLVCLLVFVFFCSCLLSLERFFLFHFLNKTEVSKFPAFQKLPP